MAGMYPPGYSYVYGPPGTANNNINSAAEKLNHSASLLNTVTQRLSSGIGDLTTAVSRTKPPSVRMPGVDVYSPNAGFTNTKVSNSLFFGTSYKSPGGDNIYSDLYANIKRDQYKTSILGRSASTIATIGGFALPGPAGTAAFVMGAMIDEAVSSEMAKKNMKGDIAAMSPKIFSRALTGRSYAGMNMGEINSVVDRSRNIFKEGEFTYSDIQGMNKSALKGGWFSNTQSIKDYSTRFKEYVDLVSEMQNALGKTSFEAGKVIEQFNRVGIDNSRKIRRFIGIAKEVSSRYSIDMDELTQYGVSAGGAVEKQYGLNIASASNMAMRYYGAAGQAFRSGVITPTEYRRMGGAQGISNMALQTTASSMVNNPLMRGYLLSRFNVNESGEVTQRQGYAPGMGIGETMNLGITSSPFAVNAYESRIREQLKNSPEIMGDIINSLARKAFGGGKVTKAKLIGLTKSVFNVGNNEATALLSTISEAQRNKPDLTGINEMYNLQKKRGTLWYSLWNRGLKSGLRSAIDWTGGALSDVSGAVSSIVPFNGNLPEGDFMGVLQSMRGKSSFAVQPTEFNSLSTDFLKTKSIANFPTKDDRDLMSIGYSDIDEATQYIGGFRRRTSGFLSSEPNVYAVADAMANIKKNAGKINPSVRLGLGKLAIMKPIYVKAISMAKERLEKTFGASTEQIYKWGRSLGHNDPETYEVSRLVAKVERREIPTKQELKRLSAGGLSDFHKILAEKARDSDLSVELNTSINNSILESEYKKESEGSGVNLPYEEAMGLVDSGIRALKPGRDIYGKIKFKISKEGMKQLSGKYPDIVKDLREVDGQTGVFETAYNPRAKELQGLLSIAQSAAGDKSRIAWNKAIANSELTTGTEMDTVEELRKVYKDEDFRKKYMRSLKSQGKIGLAEDISGLLGESESDFFEGIKDVMGRQNVLSLFHESKKQKVMNVDTINVTNFVPLK